MIVATEQASFQTIKVRKLLVLAQAWVVGDVVGDAHELIEGENRAAMPGLDQP